MSADPLADIAGRAVIKFTTSSNTAYVARVSITGNGNLNSNNKFATDWSMSFFNRGDGMFTSFAQQTGVYQIVSAVNQGANTSNSVKLQNTYTGASIVYIVRYEVWPALTPTWNVT
jgi:hypothetical protein